MPQQHGVVTIGYHKFALSVTDAAKVIELLSKGRQVDDAYDGDHERRGDGVKASYWHFKDGDEDYRASIRMEVIHADFEPQRREKLPEEVEVEA